MTIVVQDNFNTLGANVQLNGRTPAPTTAGNNWTDRTGGLGNMKGAAGGGALSVSTDGGGNPDQCGIDTGTVDMKVTATVITPGSAEEMLFGRGDTSGNPGNGYYVYVRGGTTIRDLRREDAGSFTSLQSTSWAANPASGDTYELEISGTGATVSIITRRNGVQAGATYSDSSANRKTSGTYAGFHAIFNTSVWDDFTVDNLAAAATDYLGFLGSTQNQPVRDSIGVVGY